MWVGACAMLALAAAPVWAQTRDGRTAKGTAAISGVVVSDDADAKPVRKVRVTCNGSDFAEQTTLTDETGRFAFAGLPPGRYTISASKATWITASYGARRPARPGTPLPVADGQRIQIVVRLPRGAAITGVLLDHNNQPAAGASVRAMRYEMAGGVRHLASAGEAVSDDRGTYRIYGLAPGDYVVSASMRGLDGLSAGDLRLTSDADVREAMSGAPGREARPQPRMVALAPAYFPSGTNVSQAAVVSVRAGEERDGIDFALQLVPTARIEGTVTLPEGGVPPGTEIYLIASSATAMPGVPSEGYRRSQPAGDGTFSFTGVPPGQYMVLTRGSKPMANPDGSQAAPQMVWSSASVTVDGEPIAGIFLPLEPGLTIAGRVRFTESAMHPQSLTTIRLMALPFETQSPLSIAPAAVSAGANGRFTITGVIPGRYRLSAGFPGLGRAGGWQLESISANAQDALDAPLTVLPNQHVLDALVTFSDRMAQISGTVRAAASSSTEYTVVLFPEDPRLWVPQSRRIQARRAAVDGGYEFRGVPAGSYLLALADDLENGEWFEPAVLQRLVPDATRVVIRGTEAATIDLRVR